VPGPGRHRVVADSPCREDLEGTTAVDCDLDEKRVIDPRLNRECMALREAYKGCILRADPVRRGGRWVARIVIELHQGTSVHYQPVSADPAVTYVTREEADRASIQFGKVLLDSRMSSG
jgi:hypothetical protein